jgi:perosamine synthetase
MSPEKLNDWLVKNTRYDSKLNNLINISTNRPISAIVPMHTFGFPCRIDDIVEIANRYNIPVIEDSAESLGSFFKKKHTGAFGLAGILSYNGNKTITTGGGGMIITDDKEFAEKARHITTTAKLKHKWEYIHDKIGYNFRMTNVTAAIGVAQMEILDKILENKRKTYNLYNEYFQNKGIEFVKGLQSSKPNCWLNAIKLDNKIEKMIFLEETNSNGVSTRPIWRLINKLPMYKNYQISQLENSQILEDRIVNVPSGFRGSNIEF